MNTGSPRGPARASLNLRLAFSSVPMTFYSQSHVVGPCEHLGVEPLRELQDDVPELFVLGDQHQTEQLSSWLPDHWLWNRTRDTA
jgi:hypothetical protein